MAAGDIKILDKLYVNQNLICLIVSFIFIQKIDKGCCNKWLYYSCATLFIASALSVVITLICYTKEYCRKKVYKAKCHKLRHHYIKEQINNGSIDQAHGEKIIGW